MTALYGHAWVSAHGMAATNPDGRLTIDGETWQRSLVGITGPQLAAGLDACITEAGEFPPSAPRFRAMCLGIPSFARVRIEITKAEASRSPFTRHVWQYVDGYAYRQATIRDGERMLRSAYDLAVETRMQGAELPVTPEFELTHEKPKPGTRTRAVAEAALAEIDQMLNPPRHPLLVAEDERVMAEFGCSREQAQEIVDSGELAKVGLDP